MSGASQIVFDVDELESLLSVLQADEHRVIGPTVGEEAIVYDDVASVGP